MLFRTVGAQIALRYPSLSLPDIYAATAYPLGNQAAVNSYVSERRLGADAVRRENAGVST